MVKPNEIIKELKKIDLNKEEDMSKISQKEKQKLEHQVNKLNKKLTEKEILLDILYELKKLNRILR